MNEWNFSISNYGSVWEVMVQLGLLLVFLVLGNILRRSVPFLRKSFIPSALIGGVLLILVALFVDWLAPDDFHLINRQIMKVVTYHALAIGFIASTLKVANKEKRKGLGVLSIQNGLLTGATYMLQAAFGILTVLIFVWLGSSVFRASGIILPLAFGQGPGNAMTWDVNFAIADGSFGLTLASIGFIVASLVGVIYLNVYRIKGEIKRNEDAIISRKVEDFVENHEIEDSDSVDKLSIQIGIVAICYAIAFGIMSALHATGVKMVRDIAWGFNFIFGVISATLVKVVLVQLKKRNILKYKYINNYQMDRISGFSFDLMIIAGVAAIEFSAIKNYIWVLIALTVVGTVVTFFFVRIITKHCFKGIHHHMFLVNFGTLTGTASNGMILLREVDSSFESQASDIFIVSQFPAMLTVAPLLLLTGFAGYADNPAWHLYLAMGVFLLLAVVYTTLIFVLQKKVVEKQK